MSHPFVPFDNRSFDLGELTVESADDAIAVYGSITIARDQEGLKNARTLAAYFAAAVETLEADAKAGELPDTAELVAVEVKPNPFAPA